MTRHTTPLDSHSIQDLARACARQSGRQRASPGQACPCFELFRRAFARSDQQAWQAIWNQYHRLIRYWLQPYGEGDDAVQEVFTKFLHAQKDQPPFETRFSNIQAVMGYLKRCAASVRTRMARDEERQRKLAEWANDPTLVNLLLAHAGPGVESVQLEELKTLVYSKLKSEREQIVFVSRYHHGLSPQEIYQLNPELFASERKVHRVLENLLKRLRRDKELEEWWCDGGNSSP